MIAPIENMEQQNDLRPSNRAYKNIYKPLHIFIQRRDTS